MHKSVLITGAKGFIGSNFKKKLESVKNIEIFEYNRGTQWEELENYIEKIDFIFHFAGEVRPKSDDDEFQKSNYELTARLIDLVEQKNKKIPILMASTIHAVLLKNEYGKTKREAERYLEAYGKRHNTPVWIFRLPHVFGEGCKPDYNSVISTWMHNSVYDKEITVFDRSIAMTYVYVQDIVGEFIDCLMSKQEESEGSVYIEPKITYNTTLGEVVDHIAEFKENIDNADYAINGDDFKKKLFKTYQSYHNMK